jgi:small subunit ribosomal protein S15
MALSHEKTREIIEGSRRSPLDTGSPEVQVSLLTARIEQLTGHIKKNKHDYHSRLGLTKLVGQRRKLLAYLRRTDLQRCEQLIERLGLRRSSAFSA